MNQMNTKNKISINLHKLLEFPGILSLPPQNPQWRTCQDATSGRISTVDTLECVEIKPNVCDEGFHSI